MKPGRWILILGVTALLFGLGVLLLRSGTAGMHRGLPQENAGGTDAPAGTPKVVVEQSQFDLGVVDPSEPCAHVFWIRNEGTAPLRLARGRTSCNCTMSTLPERPVAPGGRAGVRVGSKLTGKTGHFTHSAAVITSDPNRRIAEFTISGLIRTHLGLSPPRLVFSTMPRGESQSGAALLYSQAWEQFEIVRVEPSVPELHWEVERARAESLKELEARAGYAVRVTTPAGLAPGPFSERLVIEAAPQGAAGEARTLTLPITGSVPSPVELLGRRLITGTTLKLGQIRAGEAKSDWITMKVSGGHRELEFGAIETEPAQLEVVVRPLKPESPQLGLYRIEVTVPADCRPGNYLRERAGRVRIETDHPIFPRVEFRVEMVVLPP